MRRDLDLIRLLLLELEGEVEVDLSDYTEEQKGYHKYLILDAGWADGELVVPLGASRPAAELFWLNWVGHDFLDAARNESIWESARQKLSKVGGAAALSVVKELLIAIAMERLGL